MKTAWLQITLMLFLACAADGQKNELFDARGQAPGDGLGHAGAAVGDIDHDGFEDFVVGAPSAGGGGPDAGEVRAYSGRDGQLLFAVPGPAASAHLGTDVDAAGDVDGDGTPDIAATGTGATGRMLVLSGTDGSVLMSVTSGATGFGSCVCGIGDVDGDGRAEVAVGYDDPASPRVEVYAWSGGGAQLLSDRTYAGTPRATAELDLSALGDANGDGVPDVLVGEPNWANMGRVVLVSGLGTSDPSGQIIRADASPSLQPGARYGAAVQGLGDADGDQIGDYLAGAPGHDDGALTDAGAWYLRSSATGAVLGSDTGLRVQEQLGRSLACLGNQDNDGIADFAVGSAHDAAGRGRIYLLISFYGSIGSFSDGTAGDEFGFSLAGVDSDGDGIKEILVGTPGFGGAGRAQVYDFPSRGVAYSTGLESLEMVVAGGGDANGDTVPDILIGSPASDSVAIHRTGINALTVTGQAGEGFGTSVAFVGDLNGDGRDDVAVGAPAYSTLLQPSRGRVRLFSGHDGSVLPLSVVGGNGDELGRSVAGCGDVDLDGVPDIVMGAPRDDVGSPFATVDAGSARIVSGADGSTLLLVGGLSQSLFGWSVDGTGDVDGDGVPDFVVGSPGVDAGGVARGRVEIRSGAGGGVIQRLDGTQDSELLGYYAVAGVGDVDGDGTPDVAAGSPYWDVHSGGSTEPTVGKVQVMSGATGAVILTAFGESDFDFFGWTVAGPGDVNRDGHADILVGAGGYATATDDGRAYVLSGADGSVLRKMTGDPSHDRFGWSVAAAGDRNFDGYPDLLVSIGIIGVAGASFVHSPAMRGAVRYGNGVAGCRGLTHLLTSSPPAIGNTEFSYTCSNAPPNTTGTILYAPIQARLFPAADVLNVGLPLLVDPSAAYGTFNMTSNAAGFAEVAAPLPNFPPLVGFQLVLQGIWYWGPSCAGLPLGGYGTTSGLEITIMP